VRRDDASAEAATHADAAAAQPAPGAKLESDKEQAVPEGKDEAAETAAETPALAENAAPETVVPPSPPNVLPVAVATVALPAATAQPDAASAVQAQGEAVSARTGAAVVTTTLPPAQDPGSEAAEAAEAEAALDDATAAKPVPGSSTAKGAEAEGIDEAIARLASALAPANAPAAKTGAAQASAGTKTASGEGEAEAETDVAQAGEAGKPAVSAAVPNAAAIPAAPARSARSADGETKAAAVDPQPVKAEGPATPFPTALVSADLASSGTAPQAGGPTQGPAQIVHNVPLSNVPVEIGMKSLAGINHFEIRLAPDDLGRIDVKLHIDAEGQVKAHLVVDRPETLAFLQRDAAQLQQTLEQAGLKTQDGGVAVSLRNSPSDPGFGQNRGGAGDDTPRHSGRRSGSGATEATDAIAAPTRRLLWPRATGVDLHI
jgi:flagellar hook-length control protein FliK